MSPSKTPAAEEVVEDLPGNSPKRCRVDSDSKMSPVALADMLDKYAGE